MRSKDFGLIPGLAEKFSQKDTLEIFRKICLIRFFELNVKDVYDKGLIKFPIYLSVGQETPPAAISEAFSKPAIFGQHRCHGFYLANGGNITALIDELLSKPTGCAKGMGGSASIHSPEIGMYGHDGHMGSQVPIAVGYSMATKKNTMAITGDASTEEDYVLGAMGYAAAKKLPILFVCVNNNLSILTKVEVRRDWKMADVAKSFGMEAIEITDDPWLIAHHTQELAKKLPAFMDIHTCRVLWHAGTGQDSPPEWDRFDLVKKELKKLGLKQEAEEIEVKTKKYTDELWQKQLNNLKTCNP